MTSYLHTSTLTTAVAGLLLVGCAAPGAQPGAVASVPAPTVVETCNETAARSALGKRATAQLVDTARAQSGARMARILRPDQMITKEYLGSRLNLHVDAGGTVIRLTCG